MTAQHTSGDVQSATSMLSVASPPTRARLSTASLLALTAALMFYGWLAWSFRGYTADDSYIFLRYAQNAAADRGLVFNPGERVNGTTSAGWTLLLAAAAVSGLPLLAFAKTAGALLGAGCIVLAQAIARRLDARAAVAAPLILAGFFDLPYWAVSGMDAALFAFLVAAAMWLTVRAEQTGGVTAAALAWGLAGVARPEGAALGLVALVWLVWRRPAPRRLLPLVWFALPIAAWTLFAWSYYGDPLPNTYWAKRFDHAEAFRRALVTLRVFMSNNDGSLIAAGIAAALWLRRDQVTRGLAMLLGVYGAMLLWTGGDSWAAPNAFRFAVPALVPASVLMALGFAAIWDRVVAVTSPRAGAAAAIVVWAAWLIFPSTSGLVTRPVGGDAAIIGHLQTHADTGDELAVTDIGRFAYETDLRVIDTYGLVDRWVARSLRKRIGSSYAPGESAKLVEYVLQRAPRWIILKGTAGPARLVIHDETGAPAIYADARFQRDYRFVIAGSEEPYLLFERTVR